MSLVMKKPPANAGYATDADLIRVLGRSPEKETTIHSIILAWEIPWRGTWQATVHGGHKESDTTECTHIHMIYTILGFPGGSDGKESA